MAPSRGNVCLAGLALPSELLHELLYLIDVACWYHSTVIAEELGKVIRMEHHREMHLTGLTCPTPPIPERNPHRISYENPLPPLPDGCFQIEKGLLPKPLFSKLKTLPPPQPGLASVNHRPSPVSRTSSTSTTSSRSSSKSSRSSVSSAFSSPSTPASSAPNSPAVLARTFSFDPDTPWILASIKPEDVPRPLLRRKNSPKKGEETLRSLRAKGSDACLQRLYYQRTSSYLEGTMFGDEPCCSALHHVMSNDDARQTFSALA
ncbi:hypothetical protein ACN47E_008604 [Coniothyrium glycines]